MAKRAEVGCTVFKAGAYYEVLGYRTDAFKVRQLRLVGLADGREIETSETGYRHAKRCTCPGCDCHA